MFNLYPEDKEEGENMFSLEVKEDVITDISEGLSVRVDEACLAINKEEYAVRGSGVGLVALNRIGAGYIGLPCDRELAHKYHKSEKVPYTEGPVSPGELYRHARLGHGTEALLQQALKTAGLDIVWEKPDGTQYGWMDIQDDNGQFHMAGEFDGIIKGINYGDWPKELIDLLEKGVVLFESKKASIKKFEKFTGISSKTGKPLKNKGVKKADIKYYAQAQTNMRQHENAVATLFVMMNLDSMKLYAEIILPEPEYATYLHDRAERVVYSSNPEEFKKIVENKPERGLDPCMFCDYKHLCRPEPQEEVWRPF